MNYDMFAKCIADEPAIVLPYEGAED